MTISPKDKATEKVPADAPGFQLGGPEPKTRAQLVAEQETADAESKKADAADAAEANKNAPKKGGS